jgi:Tfp pilus assembly protein PilF
MKSAIALLVLPFLVGPAARNEGGGLAKAMAAAAKALDAGDLKGARAALERVLERDPNSLPGWELVERWAAKATDKDELVHALHRQLSIARAQKKDKAALEAVRARLLPHDPVAAEHEKLRTTYVDKLAKLAEGYEKTKRPHSAIRAYKQALALDPDRADIAAAIERIASAPDPSLAEDARPRDLLEGVSAEWIAEHDRKHLDWSDRAILEKPNYRTQTNAGYEVLVRTAEAMEQMNAFYRVFFRYGAAGDKRSPSRIDVNIFKTRSEYTQDPKDWSGGHYTGSAVETYISDGGFEDMTGTLFHEAAHQFVDLATNAEGWLNEGLASFFEGTRILANGTVVMNLPATHRLFPLVERMRRGFMNDVTDGIDPEDVTKDPPKAPTFRIVLENQYEWGPPWYAPTWGVVFFLYNFQDTADGRFLYRKSFWDFVDASGGKMGATAIQTFEELVLGNPAAPTPGLETTISLPRTVDQINEVWKDWLFDLAAKQSGSAKEAPPYLEWAKNAKKRGALDDAGEFLERAWQNAPTDVAVLEAYGEFLAEKKSDDRATKLLTQAVSLVENTAPVDTARVDALELRLRKIDTAYQRLDDVRTALLKDVTALIERYLADGLNLQAMELSFHLGSELQDPSLFSLYERGVRAEGRSIAGWRRAYNEEDLRGWNYKGLEQHFKPAGEFLDAKFETYSSSLNDYKILTLDEITSGDYSLECELEAQHGKVRFAGLVFGRKSANDCHVLVLFPPALDKNGFVDLASFHGSGASDTWRRNPVQYPKKPVAAAGPEATVAAGAANFKLRIDVTGRLADVWVNGEYQATQEFASLDVLRGTFGLITGRGEARFKNVRFLGRAARDPSAAIERKLTLEEKSAGGEAINGSWLGLVPPFPNAQKWFQGRRKSWDEAEGYPQLFVMWSIDQNDQLAIDAYLRDLAQKHASVGLRFVNLLAFWDEAAAEAYLAAHPFPDSVGLDTPTQAERNFGVTFERYDVMRFQLPRFILLDIDGKVAWEGDPGFTKATAWSGEESLLDVPLRELVAKRKLTELNAWRKAWPEARAALARGEFAKAVAALKGSAGFDATVSSEVAEASAYLAAVEGAAGGADALAAKLAEQGREPALEVLLEWAEALGKPVKKSKAVSAALKSPNVAAWKRAPTLLKPVLAKVGKDAAAVEDALTKVAALPGKFPAEFAEQARVNAGDAAALEAVIEEAAELPALWLASEHFGW